MQEVAEGPGPGGMGGGGAWLRVGKGSGEQASSALPTEEFSWVGGDWAVRGMTGLGAGTVGVSGVGGVADIGFSPRFEGVGQAALVGFPQGCGSGGGMDGQGSGCVSWRGFIRL